METFLRTVPLFAELSDKDLIHLCRNVDQLTLEAGEVLFDEGSEGDRAYVIRQGELEIFKLSGGREILLANRGPGEIIGEIALFEDSVRTASVRARTETELIAISREQFDRLIRSSQHAAETLFYTILTRLKTIQAQLRQSEKMAQLGTMAAGLAHELNNPVAAIGRGSDRLSALLESYEDVQNELNSIPRDSGLESLIEQVAAWTRRSASDPLETDMLVRADRQDEIETELERLQIGDPWEYSAELVDLDLTSEKLRSWIEPLPVEYRNPFLRWIMASASTRRLLYEIHTSADRITSIVKAMKSYTYLDQAPSQEVDIHRGLDDTLVILASKIKNQSGLSVQKTYDPTLPKIYGYGSELNQVWTNLLDNAIDAAGAGGQITIRTHSEGDDVVVEIEDDGSGIPDQIKDRVFDSFFTTKPPGEGTGLGLDISYNIVAVKHHGELSFTSQPGQTCFTVRLPLNFTER